MARHLIIALTLTTLVLSCNLQTKKGEQEKTSSDDSVSEKGGAVNRIIKTDTFLSAIDNQIKLVIMYNSFLQNDYLAPHQSGISDTSNYAKERGVNKGQIHFPCTNETRHDYTITKKKIVSIVRVLENTYDNRTEYIFTPDSICCPCCTKIVSKCISWCK